MARTVLKWSGGTVEFDAVETEAPSHAVDVTKYPVDGGSTMTDYVRVLPVSMRLTVHVSNDPARDGILDHMDGAVSSVGVEIQVRQPIIPAPPIAQIPTTFAGIPLTRNSTVRAQIRNWSQPIRRVQNVYEELVQAQAQARLFMIQSDMRSFPNMVLERIDPVRSAANSRAPKFELQFCQLIVATLEQRDISDLIKPKETRSNPPKDAGKKQAEEAPAVEGSALWFLTY